jgi:hypothetical protein
VRRGDSLLNLPAAASPPSRNPGHWYERRAPRPAPIRPANRVRHRLAALMDNHGHHRHPVTLASATGNESHRPGSFYRLQTRCDAIVSRTRPNHRTIRRVARRRGSNLDRRAIENQVDRIPGRNRPLRGLRQRCDCVEAWAGSRRFPGHRMLTRLTITALLWTAWPSVDECSSTSGTMGRPPSSSPQRRENGQCVLLSQSPQRGDGRHVTRPEASLAGLPIVDRLAGSTDQDPDVMSR